MLLKARMFFLNLFCGKIMAQCGHETKIWDICAAQGEKHIIKMIPQNGQLPYCHKCFSAMTIRCAWCGKPIFPGEPVTLYAAGENFRVPDYAVVFNKKPLQVVGCLRVRCADTGADRMGFWMPPGQVLRVQSPMEQMIQRFSQNGENRVVIIGDLQNPSSAQIFPQ